jgi:hypothetical protein
MVRPSNFTSANTASMCGGCAVSRPSSLTAPTSASISGSRHDVGRDETAHRVDDAANALARIDRAQDTAPWDPRRRRDGLTL